LILPQAAIFDLDGTLLDSGDLHAIAWHEALAKFGHKVSFEQVRSQIGKGGDKLIPVFLSPEEQNDHARELEEWRSQRFKNRYLPLIRPFSAVPSLLQRVREAGLQVAIASSAKRDELEQFLEIADVTGLVDETSSSEDVAESKPAPDVFKAVLEKLQMRGEDTVAVGDAPYDAEAAGKASVRTIGVLCGGFVESSLRQAGCVEVYPGPAALYCCFEKSLLGSEFTHNGAER
jgi:HAD superfamily hydrolase (TIGR01549 family)